MSELSDRLRFEANEPIGSIRTPIDRLMDEAADEIERLTAENALLSAIADAHFNKVNRLLEALYECEAFLRNDLFRTRVANTLATIDDVLESSASNRRAEVTQEQDERYARVAKAALSMTGRCEHGVQTNRTRCQRCDPLGGLGID